MSLGAKIEVDHPSVASPRFAQLQHAEPVSLHPTNGTRSHSRRRGRAVARRHRVQRAPLHAVSLDYGRRRGRGGGLGESEERRAGSARSGSEGVHAGVAASTRRGISGGEKALRRERCECEHGSHHGAGRRGGRRGGVLERRERRADAVARASARSGGEAIHAGVAPAQAHLRGGGSAIARESANLPMSSSPGRLW